MAQSRSVHPELSPRWTDERRVRTAAEMMPDLQLEERQELSPGRYSYLTSHPADSPLSAQDIL